MVRLSRAVSIEPIALSFDSGFPEQSDEVTIVGYGYINQNGPSSDEVRQIDVEVGIDQECDSGIRDEVQFCAGGSGEVRRSSYYSTSVSSGRRLTFVYLCPGSVSGRFGRTCHC
jgi:hypothetical protein